MSIEVGKDRNSNNHCVKIDLWMLEKPSRMHENLRVPLEG